jgi:hypothetical protein
MRNRALISIFLIAALSLSAIQQSTAATPKSGAACSKLGKKVNSSGQEFICVKSGKKLIWRKVATKPTPKPSASPQTTPSSTPTPSPSPSNTFTNTSITPWSTDITEKELNDAAQAEFRNWAANKTSPNGKHELVIQSELSGQRKDIFRKVDVLQAKLFSNYFEPRSVTVIGKDEVWVIKQLADRGWNTNRCNEPYAQGIEICIYHDGGMHGYVIKSDAGYDPVYPGADGGALLAHEYFHLVQWAASGTQNKNKSKNGDPASRNAFPSWMIEGSADFVGFSVAALAMNSTYWVGRPVMLTYSPPGYPVNAYAITDYEVRIGQRGDPVWIYPYHIGRVATEYIVASIGFGKFMQIWEDYKTTSNFETSFEKAAGISKEEFYKRFEIIRAKVGLPAATLAIVDGNSYPIGSKPSPSPSPSPTATSKPLTFAEKLWSRQNNGSFPIQSETFEVSSLRPTNWQDVYEKRLGIPHSAWSQTASNINSSSSKVGNVEVFVGPNTVLSYPEYRTNMDLVSRAFPSARNVKTLKLFIFNFKDSGWADSTFKNVFSYETQAFKNRHAQAVSEICPEKREVCFAQAFIDSNSDGVIMFGMTDKGSKEQLAQTYSEYARDSLGYVIGHEYMHTIQRVILGDRWYQRDFTPPSWFNEGSAVFIENAAPNYKSFDNYMRFRAVDSKLLYADCPYEYCVKLDEKLIFDYLSLAHYDKNWDNFAYAMKYEMSARTVEILVSLKGPDSLIRMVEVMASGKKFDEAFQIVYEISYDQARSIIARIIADQFANGR